MNCPACGAELDSGAVFCQKCGERVDGQGAGSAGPTPGAAEKQAAGPAEASAGGQWGPNMNRGAGDDKEVDVWHGGYSGKAMIGSWALSGLLTIVGIVVVVWFFSDNMIAWLALLGFLVLLWGFMALRMMVLKWSIDYHLTTQRLLHREGLLSRKSDRIEVIDIDDVTFRQGLIERFVNVGTVHISSSDRSHPEFDMVGIEDVAKVADLIDDVRRKERRKRGLHIERI